jgi:hypothetical protein
MAALRHLGLGFIPDVVPCIFTKKGGVHKSIFHQLQAEYEDGQALQVCGWVSLACVSYYVSPGGTLSVGL